MNENINDLDARLAQAENVLAVKDEQVTALLAEVQRLRARLAPFEPLERHVAEDKAKHDHFADTMDYPWKIKHVDMELDYARLDLRGERKFGHVTARTVLDCRMAEVYEAWHRRRFDEAEDLCYDAMAVLMRMVELVRKETEDANGEDH